MINLKKTAEQAVENLADSHAILSNILGQIPEKDSVEGPKNLYGLMGDLNNDLEIMLGLSASLRNRLNDLREIISIQVTERTG